MEKEFEGQARVARPHIQYDVLSCQGATPQLRWHRLIAGAVLFLQYVLDARGGDIHGLDALCAIGVSEPRPAHLWEVQSRLYLCARTIREHVVGYTALSRRLAPTTERTTGQPWS